jgi:hypothetical protein
MKNIKEEDINRLAKAYPDYKVAKDKLNPEFHTLWQPKGKTWNISSDLFTQDFPCVIWDEMHRCSDGDALQSKICLQLSNRAEYAIGLSGTPVDKSLLDLQPLGQVSTVFGRGISRKMDLIGW